MPSTNTSPISPPSKVSEPSILTLLVLPLILFGGIVDELAGGLRGLFGDAYDFAKKLVAKALDVVAGWIRDAVRGIHDAFDWVGGAIDALGSTVAGLVDSTLNSVGHAIAGTVGWVAAVVNDAKNVVLGIFHTFEGWTRAAISAVTDTLWQAYHTALNFAEDVGRDVRGFAAELVNGARAVLEGAIHGVESLLGHVWHDVVEPWIDKIWRWITDRAENVIHAVERAWSWIVWFGDHTFDWFRSTLVELANISPDTIIESAVKSAMADGDTLEDALARWLS